MIYHYAIIEQKAIRIVSLTMWHWTSHIVIWVCVFISKMLLLLFSHWVVLDSLWPSGLQHTRLHCPSLSPGVCTDLCPLIWWCHPTISSPIVPFSSCLHFFQGQSLFPMSQLLTIDGQNIGASASSSVLPMNIQGFISFKIDWFDLLAVQGTLKSLLQHHILNINPSVLSLLYGPTDIHTWLLEKA